MIIFNSSDSFWCDVDPDDADSVNDNKSSFGTGGTWSSILTSDGLDNDNDNPRPDVWTEFDDNNDEMVRRGGNGGTDSIGSIKNKIMTLAL